MWSPISLGATNARGPMLSGSIRTGSRTRPITSAGSPARRGFPSAGDRTCGSALRWLRWSCLSCCRNWFRRWTSRSSLGPCPDRSAPGQSPVRRRRRAGTMSDLAPSTVDPTDGSTAAALVVSRRNRGSLVAFQVRGIDRAVAGTRYRRARPCRTLCRRRRSGRRPALQLHGWCGRWTVH